MNYKNIVEVLDSDGVIVGTTNALLGRSCERHSVCGEIIRARFFISFVPDRAHVDGMEEDVIKVLSEGCHVGWAPRRDTNRFVNEHRGRKVVVTSTLSDKIRMFCANYGVAAFKFIA